MPSPRKRIGFLPRSEEVQSLIDKICAHNKLSQSKVTSLLVEEALFYRGVLKSPLNDLSLDFINDNNGSNMNNNDNSNNNANNNKLAPPGGSLACNNNNDDNNDNDNDNDYKE